MGLADRAEHFPFVGPEISAVGCLADLPERPVPPRVRLPCQTLGDLIIAHARDLCGIGALHVVTAAGHDVNTGLHRNLLEVLVVHPHVGMPAVHDADHAILGCILHVFDDGPDVCRGGWRQLELPFRTRIHSVQVLVEKNVPVRQDLRSEILEDRSNDCVSGERDIPGGRRPSLPGCRQQGCDRPRRREETEPRASTEQPDGLPATQSRRT